MSRNEAASVCNGGLGGANAGNTNQRSAHGAAGADGRDFAEGQPASAHAVPVLEIAGAASPLGRFRWLMAHPCPTQSCNRARRANCSLKHACWTLIAWLLNI